MGDQGGAPLPWVWLPLLWGLLVVLLGGLLAGTGLAQEHTPPATDDPENLAQELAARKEEEKPKLRMRAWVATGDERTETFPRGLLVPVAVWIDNQEKAFSEGRLTVRALQSYPGRRDGLEESLFESVLEGVVFEEAAPPQLILVELALPEAGQSGVETTSVKVVLERENASTVDLYLPVTREGGGFSLMVLAEEGHHIFRQSPEEIEDRAEEDLEARRDPLTGNLSYFPGAQDERDRLETMFSITYPEPAALPDRAAAWAGVWAVLVHENGATPEQFGGHLDAVVDHAIRGGTVVLVPKRASATYQSGPLAALLPVREMQPVGEVQIPLELVDTEATVGASPAPLLGGVISGKPVEGTQVLLSSPEGLPLAVRMGYGPGAVYWLGYDPAQAEVRETSLLLLRDWVRGERDRMLERMMDLQTAPDVGKYFKLHAPPRRSIMLFLALYLVLLVPGTYLVFSLLGRRELAWLAVPLLAVAFAYYYYQTGFLTKLGFLTTFERGVVCCMPQQPRDGASTRAYLRGQVVVYSPRNAPRLRVALTSQEMGFGVDLAHTLSEWRGRLPRQTYLARPGRRVLEEFAVRARAYRYLDVEGYLDLPGAITAELQQDPETGHIRGTVTNNLEGLTLVGEPIVDRTEQPDPEVRQRQLLLRIRRSPEASEGSSQREESTVLLPRRSLAPGESIQVNELNPGDYPGPQRRLAGDLAIYLEAYIQSPLVRPLLDGEERECQGASYRLLVRIW